MISCMICGVLRDKSAYVDCDTEAKMAGVSIVDLEVPTAHIWRRFPDEEPLVQCHDMCGAG